MIRSLARGLAVLDCFAADEGPVSLADISSRLGLDKTTVFRILHTLEAAGYVVQDEESRDYGLTLKVLNLKDASLASRGFPRRAQPLMEELSQRLQESVSLAVLEGASVRYVGRVTWRRFISTNVDVGTVVPAHASSLGKVLLASLPPERVTELFGTGGLPVLTPKTLGTADALLEHLATVRAQGFAVANGEMEPGQWGVSVAVPGRSGEAIAALGVAVVHVASSDLPSPEERLHAEILPALRETASRISASLGYAPAYPRAGGS